MSFIYAYLLYLVNKKVIIFFYHSENNNYDFRSWTFHLHTLQKVNGLHGFPKII